MLVGFTIVFPVVYPDAADELVYPVYVLQESAIAGC